jgi:hypothetical protein
MAVATSRIEHVRELVKQPIDAEYLNVRAQAGWTLVALEWQRVVEGEHEAKSIEDVPFGLRVAGDCAHLEEDPTERQVLILMMDLIVQDSPLSRVAEELNERGFRTRAGSKWSPVSVFKLLPRLIEAGPQIFSSHDWNVRKRHLVRFD